MEIANPLIVAFDGLSPSDALSAAELLADTGVIIKINDLLDDKDGGPAMLGALAEFGVPFADPKFFDIDNTMANRMKNIVAAGARMVTIHAANTVKAMQAAVDNRGHAIVLGVTVLTSMNEDDCNESFGGSSKARVLHFAEKAMMAGVQGIVCSPQELKFLADYPHLSGLLKVTPGIRPDWYQKKDDQARKMTPGEAIKLGADYLVMGRPILRAHIPPKEAVARTLEEIEVARAA